MKRRTLGLATLTATGATLVAPAAPALAHPTGTDTHRPPTGLPTARGPRQTPPPPQIGRLDVVHRFTGPIPAGVTVSARGRIFVTFPRWADPVEATLVELVDGREVPYPDAATNRPDTTAAANRFISIQSAVVDPADRLWALDTGRLNFGPLIPGGPKLVAIDLRANTVVRTIQFPPDVVLPTTYLNDVRFDLRRGRGGLAFITDSGDEGPNGIIVIDLATGRSWRKLTNHPSVRAEPGFVAVIEGEPIPGFRTGSDGIAIDARGERLFYCPIASRTLYSVSVDALADPDLDDASVARTVRNHGLKGQSDGLESDDRGRIYGGDTERNTIVRRRTDGHFETVVQSPVLLWPDTLSVARDRHLYVIANQLHRQPQYQGGTDERERPYALLRTPIDAGPVRPR